MSNNKFRAWDEKNKRYADDYCGVFISDEGDIFTFEDSNYDHVMVSRDYTIEQFTGLTDKNGQEIYAGDNLQYEGSPIYTVTWQKDRWQMCGTKNGNGFCVDIPDYMTIVGTIHEGEVK